MGSAWRNSRRYRPPHLDGQALVHGHCHDKSVLGFEFERGDHYRVSMAVGERALLPAVRDADPATFIVAGGFSCREQIEQGTARTVLRPADLLTLAIERDGQGVAREGPSGLPDAPPRSNRISRAARSARIEGAR